MRVELLVNVQLNSRLRRRISISDVTQEVLLQLSASRLDPGPEGHALNAWIRRAVEHVVADQHRRHVGVARRSLDAELADGPDVLDRLPARSLDSPTGCFRKAERVEALWRALSRISKDHRAVLIHRFLEGRTLAETALILNKSGGAVAVQMHRALGRLREVYAGTEPTE